MATSGEIQWPPTGSFPWPPSGQVTTKDGGNWAIVGFNGLHYRSCLRRWGFNGVVILRCARGRWEYVTAGSALLPCGRLGIPIAVRQDLHLPRAVTLTTGLHARLNKEPEQA